MSMEALSQDRGQEDTQAQIEKLMGKFYLRNDLSNMDELRAEVVGIIAALRHQISETSLIGDADEQEAVKKQLAYAEELQGLLG
jgi:hypothetical protein